MPRRFLIAAIAAPILGLAGWVGLSTFATEREIAAHEATIRAVAAARPAVVVSDTEIALLPAPVRRYLAFALPGPVAAQHLARIEAEGRFRRPKTEGFAATTATQTIAIGAPALVFAATTPIVPGIWARAYDFFAEGRMRMKAKILSTLTVVDEVETEALNRTSLRRWLLESPLYPTALLPGGPVRWQSIDDGHARAVVSGFGLETSLVASFGPDGALTAFEAEEDGDLSTSYHGSGERAERSDYRLVAGMRIPHGFVIARKAGGHILPFWEGRITSIHHE